MDSVVWLEEVGKDDVSVVGGKGASLGEMINIVLGDDSSSGISLSDQTNTTYTISEWDLGGQVNTTQTILDLNSAHSEDAGQIDQEDDGGDDRPP